MKLVVLLLRFVFLTWCCCWFKSVAGSVLFGAEFVGGLYVKIKIMLGC